MGTNLTVPRPAANATLPDILKYQKTLAETKTYEYLGLMKRIVLEAEAGARTQAANVTSKLGHCLEWYDQRHPKGGTIRNYLPIAQSIGGGMILCLEPMLKRDLIGRLTPGAVGLPDMPDPSWKPRNARTEEIQTGKFDDDFTQPPMIAQDLNQLTDKIIAQTEILVFQPVAQVLFQPEINRQLQATYWTLLFSFDPATNTHPAFLVDRKSGECAFYGGKHQLVPVG
jgi:hypothetical protein